MMRLAKMASVLMILASGCASSSGDSPIARNQAASLELARQMVGQGEFQRAVQFLLPRSRQPDAPAEVHMLLGLSFLGLKNPAVALKSFQAALKIDQDDDNARLNLAYTYILTGQLNESRNKLNEILARGKYPLMERVHLNLGLTYMQEKMCDKAVTSFQTALEIDPTYSAPYFNMGKCQFSSGRFQEAQASFQRAIDFCPGCLEPLFELATVTARLGDRRKALGQLENILNAKPESSLQQKALALKRQMTR